MSNNQKEMNEYFLNPDQNPMLYEYAGSMHSQSRDSELSDARPSSMSIYTDENNQFVVQRINASQNVSAFFTQVSSNDK